MKLPNLFSSVNGAQRIDVVFDGSGRPAVIKNSADNSVVQFFYPSATSMIIAQYGSDLTLRYASAAWKENGKYFTGKITAATARISQDVTGVSDITAAVQARIDELALATRISLNRRLFRALPLGSAYAQESTAQTMRGFASAVATSITVAVFPALAVAQALLALTGEGATAAIGTIGVLMSMINKAKSGTVDTSQVAAVMTEYLGRPYRGALYLQGSMAISTAGQSCSAAFSTKGSLSLVMQAGATARITMSALESISGPCYDQVYDKGLSPALLEQSGNQLSGSSAADPAFNNPYIYDLALSSDGLTITGTVTNPYNATSGLSGSATGTVILRR